MTPDETILLRNAEATVLMQQQITQLQEVVQQLWERIDALEAKPQQPNVLPTFEDDDD